MYSARRHNHLLEMQAHLMLQRHICQHANKRSRAQVGSCDDNRKPASDRVRAPKMGKVDTIKSICNGTQKKAFKSA